MKPGARSSWEGGVNGHRQSPMGMTNFLEDDGGNKNNADGSSSTSGSDIDDGSIPIPAAKRSIISLSSRRPSYAAEFSGRKIPPLSSSGGSATGDSGITGAAGFGHYGQSFGLWERSSPAASPLRKNSFSASAKSTAAPATTTTPTTTSGTFPMSSSSRAGMSPPSLPAQLRQFRSQSFSVGQTDSNNLGISRSRSQRPSLLSEHNSGSFSSSLARNLPIFEDEPQPSSPPMTTARGQMLSHLIADRSNSRESDSAVATAAMPADEQSEELNRYFNNDDHRVRARDNGLLRQSYPSSTSSSTSPAGPLYIVEFKACRSDVYFVPDASSLQVHIGDLVIVEADRGRDLGKVIREHVTLAQVRALKSQQVAEQQQAMAGAGVGGEAVEANTAAAAAAAAAAAHFQPKVIHRLAQPAEISQLLPKAQLENEAVQVCQSKVRMRRLPMDVVDAEYQWDRRKLTFYYCANQRIDFRELVKDLFKVYKTRIWMCAVNPSGQNNATNAALGSPGAVGDRAFTQEPQNLPHQQQSQSQATAPIGYGRYLSAQLPPPDQSQAYGMMPIYDAGPWQDPGMYSPGPILG